MACFFNKNRHIRGKIQSIFIYLPLHYYLREIVKKTIGSLVACNRKEDSLADYRTTKTAFKNLKLEEFRLHKGKDFLRVECQGEVRD